MFLKKKRCDKIKAQGCANGHMQHAYLGKEDTSSPTVSTVLSCVIDAKEGRDVAMVDVPSAFMHANMDEDVQVCLVGKMTELLTS